MQQCVRSSVFCDVYTSPECLVRAAAFFSRVYVFPGSRSPENIETGSQKLRYLMSICGLRVVGLAARIWWQESMLFGIHLVILWLPSEYAVFSVCETAGEIGL